MGEDAEGPERGSGAPTAALQIAIARLEGALEAVDRAQVPMASAYVDLAMTLCRREWERRMSEG